MKPLCIRYSMKKKLLTCLPKIGSIEELLSVLDQKV